MELWKTAGDRVTESSSCPRKHVLSEVEGRASRLIQIGSGREDWIPVFTGMTEETVGIERHSMNVVSCNK